MQTFMPYPQFHRVAEVLDDARLGAQRKEAAQILQIHLGIPTAKGTEPIGWRAHPIVHCWRGHEGALCAYGRAMCCAYAERGFHDRLWVYFDMLLSYFKGCGGIEVLQAFADVLRPNGEEPPLVRACAIWLAGRPRRDAVCTQTLPPLMAQTSTHRAYRRLLIQKNPTHYARYWPEENVPEARMYWVEQTYLAHRDHGMTYDDAIRYVDEYHYG